MKWANVVGLIAVVLALGCTDETSLLIEVTSGDLTVPADVDGLRFEIESDSGRKADETFSISGAWPHSLAVLPASSSDMAVTVTVTGLKDGAPVVRRVVGAQFLPKMQRRVEVRLDRACLGLPCPDGIDCVAGTCVGTGEPDGGVPMDGGTDAGPGDDAAMPDAGEPDGGVDAGSDGGTEPEPDGGADSGTPMLDGGHSRPTTLLITEYVEGVANDKAIEIFNGTDAAVDLSACAIDRYSNGTTTPFSIALNGTVAPGGFFVLCHNQIADDSRCDATSGALNHNGNDVLVLVCEGATIDSFGQIGHEDPWIGENGISSADHTLTRKCEITTGRTDPHAPFVIQAEWEGGRYISADVSLTGLGNRTECP